MPSRLSKFLKRFKRKVHHHDVGQLEATIPRPSLSVATKSSTGTTGYNDDSYTQSVPIKTVPSKQLNVRFDFGCDDNNTQSSFDTDERSIDRELINSNQNLQNESDAFSCMRSDSSGSSLSNRRSAPALHKVHSYDTRISTSGCDVHSEKHGDGLPFKRSSGTLCVRKTISNLSNALRLSALRSVLNRHSSSKLYPEDLSPHSSTSLVRKKSIASLVPSNTNLGQTEKTQPSLDELPDDVIFIICRYLPRDNSFANLRSINRRFRQLLFSPYALRVNCLVIEDGIKPKLVLSVIGLSHGLTRLDVSGCLSVSDDFLIYISKNCRNISEVDVSGCVMVTDNAIEHMAGYLKKITSLAIANLRLVTTDGILHLMKQHRESLKELNLSCCYGLENCSFRLSYLGEFCPNLEKLSFRWSIAHCSWIPLWERRISQFCSCCPKLKFMDLAFSPSRDIKEVVEMITTRCKELEHLNFSRCCLQDENLVEIGMNLPKLKHVNVSYCPELTGLSMTLAFRNLTIMHHLDISGCYKVNDEAMPLILAGLPQLRILLVRECHDLTDAGLVDAPNLCPKLGFFDVSGTMLSTKGADIIQKRGGVKLILVAERCPLFGKVFQHIWRRIPMVFIPSKYNLPLYDESEDVPV